jgi:hypothetical protein
MRGGYLRFQAQYLRKIRIPPWEDVGPKLRARLERASESDDPHLRNEVVSDLYQLDSRELRLIEGKTTE